MKFAKKQVLGASGAMQDDKVVGERAKAGVEVGLGRELLTAEIAEDSQRTRRERWGPPGEH